jgi:hypothetical protein
MLALLLLVLLLLLLLLENVLGVLELLARLLSREICSLTGLALWLPPLLLLRLRLLDFALYPPVL